MAGRRSPYLRDPLNGYAEGFWAAPLAWQVRIVNYVLLFEVTFSVL